MQKTLLLFCAIALSTTLNAQSLFIKSPEKVSIENQKTTNSEEQVLLTYSSDELATNGLGLRAAGTLEAAVLFSADKQKKVVGNQIKSIKIGLLNKNLTNVSVWITTKLGEKNIYSQDVPSIELGWNEIVLTAPYVIDGTPIYVGFTSYQPANTYPLSLTGTDINGGAYLGQGTTNSWESLYGEGYGNLSIQCVVVGDNLPQHDISLENIEPTYGYVDGQFVLSGNIKNNAAKVVNSFEISYKIGDAEPVRTTLQSYSIVNNKTAPFKLEGIAPSEFNVYDISVTIEKVNEIVDEDMSDNTLTTTIIAFDQTYPKKVVAEEGTGTWCGWCPRGIVGMEMMKEKYPDTFIGIAVHNGDRMAVSTYTNSLGAAFPGGYPFCVVNRKKSQFGDPYYNIEEFYLNEMKWPSEIGLNLEAEYEDGTNKKVVVKTTATCGFNSTSATYRIAYVLMENKVTGYTQANSYSGGGNGPMGGFENLPATIPADQIEFNDVARGIYQYSGLANSIPATVVKNEPILHTYTITLPSTIQNKENIELVAMVINTKTGAIVNAEIAHIEPYSNISTSQAESIFEGYSLMDKNLLVDINTTGDTTIELYHVNGSKIATSAIIANGKETVSIPVTGLKGVYFIKITNNKNVVSSKILL